MRRIGFSTGALAKGEVKKGAVLLADQVLATAIELSALRISELQPLIEAVPSLELRPFGHVSIHAPSRFTADEEAWVIERLTAFPRNWPVIVHPDAMHDVSRWHAAGPRIVLENMDGRKRTARTVDELTPFFVELPAAGFCLDLAHARHVDPAGGELRKLFDAFGSRLVQLHVSSVNRSGEHRGLDEQALGDLRSLAPLLRSDVAVILESVVPGDEVSREIELVAGVFGA